jgi:stalled ribosome alternative rescue factor ArfA
MTKRNPIAVDLRSSKYKIRVVRAKKGKGSYTRKSKKVFD